MDREQYAFRCGVIDAFNEMVRAGLKPLAMAHPCADAADRDSLLDFCRECCGRYGTRFYPEDDTLLTDLFPAAHNRGTFNILFYREEETLAAYLALKDRKAALRAAGNYRGEERRRLALEFGALLGYPEADCRRMIDQNGDKEP